MLWVQLSPWLQLHIQRFRPRQHSPATDAQEKCQRLLDIGCPLPGINAKGNLLNPFSETPLRSHRVLPMDNSDAVLFRRGLFLYKDKLLKMSVLID